MFNVLLALNGFISFETENALLLILFASSYNRCNFGEGLKSKSSVALFCPNNNRLPETQSSILSNFHLKTFDRLLLKELFDTVSECSKISY